MNKRTKLLSVSLLAGAALIALAAGPCVEHRDMESGLGSFRVTVSDIQGVAGGDGTAADPYDYAADPIAITLDVQALDKLGQPLTSYGNNGEVAVFSASAGAAYPDAWAFACFHDGRIDPTCQHATWEPAPACAASASCDTYQISRLRGRTVFLVKEAYWVEETMVQGPLRQLPQYTVQGSYATGASANIHFDLPTLRNVQIDDYVLNNLDIDYSALDHDFVEVDTRIDDPDGPFQDGHGNLLVTGIFNEGFYATDLADTHGDFNHLYAYSYSYPENLEVGDRLDRLTGLSSDFSGFTEFSFPTWKRATNASHDPEPFQVEDIDSLAPPVLVTTAMCDEDSSTSSRFMCGHSKQNWTLEALEGARVRLENLRTPDVFLNCDFNEDSTVDWEGIEVNCRDACLKHAGGTTTVREVVARPEVLTQIAVAPCQGDQSCASGKCGGYTAEDQADGMCRVVCPWEAAIAGIRPNCVEVRIPSQYICGELSTMRNFGQWPVGMDGGAGPLINVVTRETLVDFDPEAQDNLGLTIDFVQGNLKQVRAARPRWMVMVGILPTDSPESLKP